MFRTLLIATLLALTSAKVAVADFLPHSTELAGRGITALGQLALVSNSDASTSPAPVAHLIVSSDLTGQNATLTLGTFQIADGTVLSELAAEAPMPTHNLRSDGVSRPEGPNLFLLGSGFVGIGFLMRWRSQGTLESAA